MLVPMDSVMAMHKDKNGSCDASVTWCVAATTTLAMTMLMMMMFMLMMVLMVMIRVMVSSVGFT